MRIWARLRGAHDQFDGLDLMIVSIMRRTGLIARNSGEGFFGVGGWRWFSPLSVFDAGFYVGPGGFDQFLKRRRVWECSGAQLYVAHALARALQQMGWIGEGRALVEADVDVRGEDVDVGEGRVAEAGDGAAVMEELADFVAALAHRFEPVAGDGAQFGVALVEPGVDGGVVGEGVVEAEEVGLHGCSFLLLVLSYARRPIISSGRLVMDGHCI